jgi:hypothetical protein
VCCCDFFFNLTPQCPKSREIKDEVPAYYYPQIQMQLECCDLEVCDFVQYSPYGHQSREEILMITEVKRDREWWAEHLHYFEEFHNEVQSYKANPPPPLPVLEI